MNYTRHFKCGCKVTVIGELTNAEICYCSKHKAAPDMYEALKKLIPQHSELCQWGSEGCTCGYENSCRRIEQALAKAEGK